MNIFSQKSFLAIILIIFLGCQLIYSFSFPVFGLGDNWQNLATYLPKFENQSQDDFLLRVSRPFISKDYRLVSDTGNYLELAQNFNSQYFRGHVFLNRPLYPFLIFLISLPIRLFSEVSYGIVFALAILVNFILAAVTVLLLFSLFQKLFSLKIAFLSSVLLIFSPHMHVSLIQPLAEMLMALAVVLSAFFLYDYAKKPSILKILAYSLIIGVLMLGKMFYAITFFIIFLAVCFKRFKEGAIFLAVQLIPLGFWYFWVTRVWKMPYYLHEVSNWRMGSWLLDLLKMPWLESLRILLSSAPLFIETLVYGFLLIPLIFSVIGFRDLPFKSKNIIYFGSFLSIFALFFAMNLYSYHHAFLLFPIVYPTCLLGMRKLPKVLYAISFAVILIVSSLNIGIVFDWFGYLNT